MRLLFLSQHYHPEKVPGFRIAEELAKRGHEVTVLCQVPHYGLENVPEEFRKGGTFHENGVRVVRLRVFLRKKGYLSLALNYLSFYFASLRWARRHQDEFDVTYAWSLSPVIYLAAGRLLKRKSGTRMLVHVLDCWPASVFSVLHREEKGILFSLLRKWSERLYCSADEILASSPSFIPYLMDVCRTGSIPISYLPQPMDEERPGACPSFPKKNHSFLYAGNVGRLQLVPLLIKAMQEVREEDIDLHIFGNGSMLEECKSLARELGLGERVVFHDPVPMSTLAAIARTMDASFVSLRGDGSVVSSTVPNKLINSLSYGIPVIGVIEGDGARILKEAGGSMLVEPEEKAIAKAIEDIASLGKEERKRLGALNERYARTHFSLDGFVDEVERKLTYLAG